MTGPCAKQTVRATVVAWDGQRFSATNDCLNPQAACPREGMATGEGYHLCLEICEQTGHAEVNALRLAGESARGAVLYVEGHTYACGACSDVARLLGALIVIGAPPA